MNQQTTNHGSRHDPQLRIATTPSGSPTSTGTKTVIRQILRITQECHTSNLRQRSRWYCWATIFTLVGTAWAMPPSPTSPQRANRSSLTDQLLEDSSPQPDGTARKVPRSSRLSPPPLVAGSDIGESTTLLMRVGRRMQAVAARLKPTISFDETQRMQKDILTDLDKLLQRTAPNSTGKGKKPPRQGAPPAPSRQPQLPNNDDTKPNSRNSALQRNLADAASESRTARQKRLWGSLPKQIRDRLRNVSNEQVVPKYQLLVDAYYERLSRTTQIPTNPETTD